MLLKSLFIILPITINLTGAVPRNRHGPAADKIVYESSSAIVFGSQVLEKVLTGTVQVAANLPSKFHEGVQTIRAGASLHRDGFDQNSASSGLNVQQTQFDQNANQQTTSARPNSYAEKQPSAGNRDSSDNLNHQSASPSYQTSTQRSQNSYSQQQDNDRSQADRRPSPNNSYGNSSPYNKNSDGLLPEGIPFAESDSGFRDSSANNYQPATSTSKWTTQYSTQGYALETTSRRTQGRPTPSESSFKPTTPKKFHRAPPQPQHVIDPNPILSPVDRVPVQIEYPKIDYDNVELTTRAPLNKNPNRHKNKNNQGNEQNRSPDATS